MAPNDPPESIAQVYSGSDIAAQVTVYDGRSKEEIRTDADKVKLALLKYKEAIKWRTDWIGLSGIIIPIFISLNSTTLNEFWMLNSEQVKFLFELSLIISILSWLYVVIYSILHWNEGKIKKVVDNLKDGCHNLDW